MTTLRVGLHIACMLGLLGAASSAFAAETLEQAWTQALRVDHRLQASRLVTESTRATLAAARGARLPSVDVQAGRTHLSETPTAQGSFTLPASLGSVDLDLALPLQQPNFTSYRAEVTLPLYTGGRISQGIDAARNGVNAADYDAQRMRLDVKLAVAEAYVAVLRTRRLIGVVQSNVTSLTAFARDVDNLYDQGLVARNDTLAAQVALADARQREIVAGNALDLAQAAYNRLLGRPLDQKTDLAELDVLSGPSDLAENSDRADTQRPELKALDAQHQALVAQSRAVRGGTLPQVAVSGGYTFQENRYQANEGYWSATLGVKWALFDGGILRNQAAAVAARAASTQALRDDAASLVALQVRQAWLDTQETGKRIDVARTALASAEENLRIARDRYNQGLANHTEVLEAETLRTRSHTNYYAALYDAALARLRLKRATGDL
jgi:outer membrane protein